MSLPDKLSDFAVVRGCEDNLELVADSLRQLSISQADTLLEGMLLSALAAVHGARASLADIRLAWDEHCQPEDVRGAATTAGSAPTPKTVPDLMAALEQSVADAKAAWQARQAGGAA